MASPLEDKDHANKCREQISDFLNDIIENKNKITPKFKVFQNIPVTDILKLLPKTNCKECGFKTCIAFAAMVSKQRALPSKCPYVGLPITNLKIAYSKYRYCTIVWCASFPFVAVKPTFTRNAPRTET